MSVDRDPMAQRAFAPPEAVAVTARRRIHVFGAAGSGTTTLGRALADALDVGHLDADHYYWQPSDPPYRVKHPAAERVRTIERDIAGRDGWVLSGSLCGWGDSLMCRFTLAVFLYLEPSVRLDRLAARERARYGDRIEPGGDMRGQWLDFMAWAASYDMASAPVRSLDLHESWMTRLPCPVLRLDSRQGVTPLVDSVLREIGGAAVAGSRGG